MASEILVNVNVVSPASSTGSWANITDMSVTNITVQATNSVLILMFQAQLNPASDNAADFRFYVNGSEVGSPIGSAFSDSPTNTEANSVTLIYAVTGLSGSSNSFSVQWITLQGSPAMDESRNRTFQILEITGGDAVIEVNASAFNQIGDPGTWTDLFTSGSITIAGTSSVIIMIGNVPYNMEADECTDFRFAVDSTEEGAVTSVFTDEANGGNSWSGVHCLDGLSSGTHTFHLEWQARTGAGQTAAKLRTFQVIEVTANSTLELSIPITAGGSAPGSYGDVDGLSSSYTVDGTDAIALIFANIQINAQTDRSAHFMIGVDSVEEGAELISFTDGNTITNRILLARAKTGLSNASHTFAARWQDIVATPTLDSGRTRTLFVIEFTQAPVVTYHLTGVTKDNSGSVLVSCECWLVKDNLDNSFTFVAFQVSNGATGVYDFTGMVDNDAQYQVLSVKDGTPVMDCTDKVLQPVVE